MVVKTIAKITIAAQFTLCAGGSDLSGQPSSSLLIFTIIQQGMHAYFFAEEAGTER